VVICALLAIRLGSINFGLSLPHAANGRYKAMISCDPVPGAGRSEPVEPCRRANAYSRPKLSVVSVGFAASDDC
jgi:hypothetical protein